MSKEITAVILAGGQGVRMGDLTVDRQKCMLPVEGKPILGHILDNIHEAFGSANLIIATGHNGNSVRDTYGSKYKNINISYVHSPEKLETKRRLLLAADLIQGPFLFTPGDVLCNPQQFLTVAELYEKEKSDGMLGVISGAVDHKPAPTHAIITVENGHAVEMVFPPSKTWKEEQLREMQIAFYDGQFIFRLKRALQEQISISGIIGDAIQQGSDFVVDKYFYKWYHFVKPSDLLTNLDFGFNK